MESKKVKIEDLEIGVLRYNFEATIFFSQHREPQGEFTPASCDTWLEGFQVNSEIHCFNTETEKESIVTDPAEIKMIEEWVDWKDRLQKSF